MCIPFSSLFSRFQPSTLRPTVRSTTTPTLVYRPIAADPLDRQRTSYISCATEAALVHASLRPMCASRRVTRYWSTLGHYLIIPVAVVVHTVRSFASDGVKARAPKAKTKAKARGIKAKDLTSKAKAEDLPSSSRP